MSNSVTNIQWTAQKQLDDLDFADELALLSHTHEQMQIKMWNPSHTWEASSINKNDQMQMLRRGLEKQVLHFYN
ncbi:unnamed protein product [Schistosoma margrebowiei]|uniref:Uncharacterized protein n=1 Tax=Schistosoma margrebowiei TaxID=48269 RepID=A0A183LKY7_9TREM|nr:unnamed protein product [Schistosoma margrebowiei]